MINKNSEVWDDVMQRILEMYKLGINFYITFEEFTDKKLDNTIQKISEEIKSELEINRSGKLTTYYFKQNKNHK